MDDFEEWEFVSHDSFLDDEDTKIYAGEHLEYSSITDVFNMEHFASSSPKSSNIAKSSVMPNRKHNQEAPGEVMKENILHKSSLINTGIKPEDIEQQDTSLNEDDGKISELEETNGANIFCKKTLGGLLAICSFAAAAIICVVFLGKRWQHDQKLRFQIHSGDGKVCE